MTEFLIFRRRFLSVDVHQNRNKFWDFFFFFFFFGAFERIDWEIITVISREHIIIQSLYACKKISKSEIVPTFFKAQKGPKKNVLLLSSLYVSIKTVIK